jgi:hypothetical protein
LGLASKAQTRTANAARTPFVDAIEEVANTPGIVCRNTA